MNSGFDSAPYMLKELPDQFSVAVAAYLAVEETWDEKASDAVLRSVSSVPEDPRKWVRAGALTRCAILASWWLRGDPSDNWTTSVRFAKRATELVPAWLLPSLVIFDALIAGQQWSEARAALDEIRQLPPVPPGLDGVALAVELVFGGRAGWGVDDLDNLARRVPANRL